MATFPGPFSGKRHQIQRPIVFARRKLGLDDDCGSLEVWFADGRVSVRFYWDKLVPRRLNSGTLTREQAVEKATMLARAEMDKLG